MQSLIERRKLCIAKRRAMWVAQYLVSSMEEQPDHLCHLTQGIINKEVFELIWNLFYSTRNGPPGLVVCNLLIPREALGLWKEQSGSTPTSGPTKGCKAQGTSLPFEGV